MHKRLLGLLATAAIVMAACGGATTTTAPPAASGPVASGDASAPPASGGLAAEQIVRIALPGEPPTLDPNAAQDANSLTVLRALHRPLVYIDKDLNVVDALAESHEISADAKTLTFHLRDAKYSNGEQIVAADLVYSWKRLVDPRTADPYSYVMAEVAGAGELLGMDTRGPSARCRDRRGPRQAGCRGAGRQDLRRHAGHPRNVLPVGDDPVGRRADPGEVDQRPRARPRRRTTSARDRSCSTRGTTTARSS